MLEYTGSNPAAPQPSLSSFFKTIAVLRIGAGVLLLIRHGWTAAVGAYHFLWSERDWDWVRIVSEAGFPYPHLLTPALALVVLAVGLSWSLGFLTRLFAVVFLPVITGFLIFAQFSGGPYLELAWLYLFITVTLMLYGSGVFSLDKLFHFGADFRTARKKKKRGGGGGWQR